MSEIIPAILPKTEDQLLYQAELMDGVAPLIHLDVLENDIWEDINNVFEVHLMISEPESVLGRWVERGAKRVVVHEISEEVLMHQHLVEIGLGVLLSTPLHEVLPLISTVDYIHLMSITEIGEQGHHFEPIIFDRIKKLSEAFPEIVIAVDGGINLENAEELLEAGADRLIIGSAIFSTDDPEGAYADFLKLI